MSVDDQGNIQETSGTAIVAVGVATEGPTDESVGRRIDSGDEPVTEADVGGVAIHTNAGGEDPNLAPPAKVVDHKSLLHGLLDELAHVEHMGKSEIAAVLAKFRALV